MILPIQPNNNVLTIIQLIDLKMIKKVKIFFISKRLLSFVVQIKIMTQLREYDSQEVVNKAMDLFWRNGYQTTSIQILKK